MHVLTGMHVRLTGMLGYRLLQIASVVHQPEPDTASDCTAAESGSTAVKGAGRAAARRPSLSPAYTSGPGRRRRPPGCVRHPGIPPRGAPSSSDRRGLTSLSGRIAPVVTVPIHHQRPFHAAVASERATQPADRSYLGHTRRQMQHTCQGQSRLVVTNEASGRSGQAAAEATSCTSRWANGRAAVHSSSDPTCSYMSRKRSITGSSVCRKLGELRALMRCNG